VPPVSLQPSGGTPASAHQHVLELPGIAAIDVLREQLAAVTATVTGRSEAETFWTAFLRKLARRGLCGVKLVISDPHKGIKAAVSKALWQRCRVHFMRNVLAHAGRQGRRVVSAFIATAFAQDDAEAARAQWRRVADQLRPKLPKLAAFMDDPEADVLACASRLAALDQSDRARQ
jgi:putative transposase